MPTTVKDLLLVASVAAPTVTPAAATDLVEKPDAPIFDVRNGTEAAARCKVKRALARHLFGAALAKLYATAAAQRVIDDVVQIFGGLGVKSGMIVESLYREIRAPRIYEGA